MCSGDTSHLPCPSLRGRKPRAVVAGSAAARKPLDDTMPHVIGKEGLMLSKYGEAHAHAPGLLVVRGRARDSGARRRHRFAIPLYASAPSARATPVRIRMVPR